jgi:hypothetical protein
MERAEVEIVAGWESARIHNTILNPRVPQHAAKERDFERLVLGQLHRKYTPEFMA